MPIKSAFKAEIKHVGILDENGSFDAKLGKDLIPNDDLIKLYEHMVMCRELDEIAFLLQRSGRMGTYPQNMGQEATSLGAAYVLDKADWLVTCYRENAGLFWHGVPMTHVLLHWMGDERGNYIPDDVHATPLSIPIGTQMLHATGIAWASKNQKKGEIACTFFGDGATSEGDFHEAANFAANLDIPVIFFCQNNGWAISVPSKIQSSAPTFAQRGIAYGMECWQCDGNDIFAVVKVMKDAAKIAREENRPVFIEGLTYRLGDHTTADDARRYRDADELESWKKKDPLLRLRKHMEKNLKIWDQKKEDACRTEAKAKVEAIVAEAEGIEAPAISDFFDHMYATTPPDLAKQRDTMRTSGIGQDPSQIDAPTPAGTA
ncbi:MAG: pyruvate dehydrogenase (acetyl-transferring) E1 component subunit alpha [Phycisphaerales bacterium]